MMIAGSPPFWATSSDEIKKLIKEGKVQYQCNKRIISRKLFNIL